MTKDEALKLAMDWYGSGNQDPDEFERLILSIVAQTEQDGECKHCTGGCPACDARKLPEQEPVAWRFYDGKMWCYVNNLTDLPQLKFEPLYTTPPHSTWVGLTEDEVFAVSNTMPYGDRFDFAEAIEAKLKEKNT
jgi:hypothetical protein